MQSEEMKKVLKAGSLFLMIITIFFVFKIVLAAREMRNTVPTYNTITVNGAGEVFAVADVATFSFTVRTDAPDIATAQTAATEKVNAALEAVRALGVEDADMKTTNFMTNPKYKYGYYTWETKENPVVGYEVAQTTEVKLRATDKTGEFVAKLAEVGVTEVSGPNFTVEDEDALKEEARALAIADAKAEAERLAADLGVRLVRITSFYDESGNGVYYGGDMGYAESDMMMVKAVPAPQMPAGENKIMSNVSITYEIR